MTPCATCHQPIGSVMIAVVREDSGKRPDVPGRSRPVVRDFYCEPCGTKIYDQGGNYRSWVRTDRPG
jgi:hypothetical protein